MAKLDEEIDYSQFTIIDRRKNPQVVMIHEDQIEQIAERAAEIAEEKIVNNIYQNIGKRTVDKLTWLFGIVFAGAMSYAASKGWISFGE